MGPQLGAIDSTKRAVDLLLDGRRVKDNKF